LFLSDFIIYIEDNVPFVYNFSVVMFFRKKKEETVSNK